MTVKAIRLDLSEELHHKILDAMFGGEQRRAHVEFSEIAKKLGVSKEVVRYNVKKLKELGYISENKKAHEYELSEIIVSGSI